MRNAYSLFGIAPLLSTPLLDGDRLYQGGTVDPTPGTSVESISRDRWMNVVLGGHVEKVRQGHVLDFSNFGLRTAPSALAGDSQWSFSISKVVPHSGSAVIGSIELSPSAKARYHFNDSSIRWIGGSTETCLLWPMSVGATSNNQAKIQDAFSRLKNVGTVGAALARQIASLIDAVTEEEPDFEADAASIESVAEFFSLVRVGTEPKISFSPRNNIYVRWRDANKRVLGLEFFPNNRAGYVVLGMAKDGQRGNHYGNDALGIVTQLLQVTGIAGVLSGK